MPIYRAGEQVGDYILEKCIAHGGFADIWQARPQRGGTAPVAFKVLMDNSAAARERFLKEYEILHKIDHRNLVKAYTCSASHAASLWYTMEYLAGATLKKMMQADLALHKRVDLLCQISAGVQALHDRGVIHRDLKPENVMVVGSRAVVLDLGLARLNWNRTLTGHIVGTPSYMSPEQVQNPVEVDIRTDVWSLGVIMYLWFWGRLPFACQSPKDYMSQLCSPEPVTAPAEGVSASGNNEEVEAQCYVDAYLREVCLKALRKNRVERFNNMPSLRVALLGWRHANAQKHLERSRACAGSQDWEGAIAEYVQGHIWSAAICGPGEFAQLWEKRLGKSGVRICMASDWEKVLAKAGKQEREVVRYYKGQHAVAALEREVAYVVYGYTNAKKRGERFKAKKARGWFGEALPDGMRRGEKRGEYIWAKDQSVMVYVPPGPFWRGSEEYSDEKPVRRIELSGYYIDKYLITWRQHLQFCKARGYRKPEEPDWGIKPDHPVVNVSWDDLQAYVAWAGKHLPSEAQWEKAARGGLKIPDWESRGEVIGLRRNPLPQRRYPWGDQWDKSKCNNEDSGLDKTSPVGSYPGGVSPYGCHDLSGNVWEWCQDVYAGDYYAHSPAQDPVNDVQSTSVHSDIRRLCRGGSWVYVWYFNYRCAGRYWYDPSVRNDYLGGRAVRS